MFDEMLPSFSGERLRTAFPGGRRLTRLAKDWQSGGWDQLEGPAGAYEPGERFLHFGPNGQR